MKLKEIYRGIEQSILNEILDYDNIDEYDFIQINPYEFKFKTSDNSEVYIQFEEFSKSEIDQYFRFPETFQDKLETVFNTAFSVDGFETQAKKTNIAYTLPIFKTITQINQSFISKNNPDCITVFATSRNGAGIDETKLKIWKLIANKHKPSGYKLDKCFKKLTRDGVDEGFCLFKSNFTKR